MISICHKLDLSEISLPQDAELLETSIEGTLGGVSHDRSALEST